MRVVGFVLKKLFTYFEMLIVPPALHSVDRCIFLHFTTFDSQAYCFGFSPPPPHTHKHFFFRFRFLVKIHLLESSIIMIIIVKNIK